MMKSFLNSGISGFLAAFLWVSAMGVGVGGRMQGHQEMVSFWSSGSQGPGTGGEVLEKICHCFHAWLYCFCGFMALVELVGRV